MGRPNDDLILWNCIPAMLNRSFIGGIDFVIPEIKLAVELLLDEPPISTNEIISKLDENNNRKPPTVLTLLMRLIDKGFLTSERKGKERIYCPAVAEQDYLQYETDVFIKKFHQSSLTNLVNTLYDGKKLTEQDMKQLADFLRERGGMQNGKID